MAYYKRKCFWCFLLYAFLYVISDKSLAVTITEKIDSLLLQRKYQDAYILANKLSTEEMGNPNFDLLLGKSALAVKKHEEAIMAFERVLMYEPNNTEARLGITKSYYSLKMYDQAKSELQVLTSSTVPITLKKEIQLLSTELDKKILAQNKTHYLYGGVSFGYDNNIAITSDEDYMLFLALANYNVSDFDEYKEEESVRNLYSKLGSYNDKIKAFYLQPLIGIRGIYKKPKYNLFWDINTSYKEYFGEDGYDVNKSVATLGCDYHLGSLYSLTGILYYQEYLKDGKRDREIPLVSLGISRILNKSNIIKIYTNDGLLLYPDNREISVYLYVGGMEWLYVNARNRLTTQVYYGRNSPRGGSAKYSGSNYYGANITAEHKLTPKSKLEIGYMYQSSLYDEKEYAGAEGRRTDSYNQVAAGIYYDFHKNCTWYVKSIYTNNHSNIFIYKYDELEALTGISFSLSK